MDQLEEIYLLKYLQGECTAEELGIINKWLNESADNKKILFNMEMAWMLQQETRYSKSEVLDKAEKRFLSSVAAYKQRISEVKRSQMRFVRVVRYATVAAVLAVAVVFAVTFKGNIIDDDIIVSVFDGDSVQKVVLPDGSQVWINESSTLKYPKEFSTKNRNVYLDGEAYFEVVKNPAAPFVVNSKSVCVTVLGTTFNLKSSASELFAEATLIEGEIKIKGNNDEGQIVLLPNQTAEVDLVSKRMTVKSVNAKLHAVWHNNLIPFSEASLREIMDTLEQLYNVRIRLAVNVDTTTRYSGVITKKDSIDNVLDLLNNSIPITYKVKNRSVYIEQAPGVDMP